jgi:DNA replication protein DnaC
MRLLAGSPHLSPSFARGAGFVRGGRAAILGSGASGMSTCPICDGMGMRVVERGGRQFAEPCDCRDVGRTARLLARARIPKRYEHCILDSFEGDFGADATLTSAKILAQNFVREYPLGTEGKGLLLVGSIGVGKTHLAVGILQALIQEKNVKGLFVDYRELLKEIQHSYNAQVATTELDLLRPVFDAEVLVLDELGAQKPTDWVWDTVALILNSRYNDKLTTIITTNYADQPPGGVAPAGREAARAMREETLGDRIGERMRSRLAEMCVVVEMRGEDFRRTVRRARFG